MFSVAAYPLLRPVAAPVVRRGGFLAYARAATLSIWMFTLVLQYWYLGTFEASQENVRENTGIRTDFVVGFAICLAAHLTLGISVWLIAPFKIMSTWSGRIFTIFCALMLLLAPISLVPTTSGIYALGTWAVYLLLFLYWQGDYRVAQRMLVVAGFVLQAWLFIILMKHGLSLGFGGGIGGINRNTSASAGLAGMICCMTSPKKSIRWVGIAIGIFMALIVTSRGTIVAMSVFFVTYYACYKGTFRAAAHLAGVLVLIFATMLVVPRLNHLLFERILLLHDSSRGISSGFSGRVDAWKQAFSVFWERPIFGVGFRATTHRGHGDYGAIHSGYLKIFVETGFVGAFLVIGAVVIEAMRRFRLALRFRNLPPETAPAINVDETIRINAIACGTIVMMLGFWVYEQLYINIGSAISIVFFLMMVAPTCIPKQGAAVR